MDRCYETLSDLQAEGDTTGYSDETFDPVMRFVGHMHALLDSL